MRTEKRCSVKHASVTVFALFLLAWHSEFLFRAF
jgi:hypothetical protein